MDTDHLSLTFTALAHPARRAMLLRLSKGEASVQELSKPLRMSAPAVTKHLKILERSGLISRSREAQWRPCHFESKPIEEARDWIDQVKAMTAQHLDRLEAYLQQIQSTTEPNDSPAKQTRKEDS